MCISKQCTFCILLGVGIAEEEEILFSLTVAIDNLDVLLPFVKPCVVAVIDSHHSLWIEVKFAEDIVAFEIGDGDDIPAFVEDGRYHPSAIEPSEVLIK